MNERATRVLVTGANGFVGRALCDEAVTQGLRVRGATRVAYHLGQGIENIVVGVFNGATDWTAALQETDVVIHLAARVHVMRDSAADPMAEFIETNLHGTANLARQAARAGIRRFVYVSTIKVNGEETSGSPLTSADEADPHDPYAISKWRAEQALRQIARKTGMEIVIVRPPLVYGARVKGNFAQMLKALAKGLPLPLASVHNLRSLIYVRNLVDALILCSTHPSAAGQIYLVSDGEDISTPELLRQLGEAMGHPARLIPCPPVLLKMAGHLTGKSRQIERLLGSLQVESAKIRRELNWTPPYSLQQGLQETAKWYRTHL